MFKDQIGTNVLKQNPCIQNTSRELLEKFWEENPVFREILLKSRTVEEARERVYHYLAEFDRKNLQGKAFESQSERKIARKALQVLKNIFAQRSEKVTGFSALTRLFHLAHSRVENITISFMTEFRHLFLAMKGNTAISSTNIINIGQKFREAHLLKLARTAQKTMENYTSGLSDEIIKYRQENRKKILNYFNATESDWYDWKWQLGHVLRDENILSNLISLTEDEKEAIRLSRLNKIPFGVTPYYVSLMDQDTSRIRDHAVRAQVLPNLKYVNGVIEARKDPTKVFDFMGEKETSPRELVTRRYPMVAIMKPFNTCAQICVYCQRNWEIEDVMSSKAQHPFDKIRKALEWFSEHKEVNEILITGGDPGVMSTSVLSKILDIVSTINHIKRIRIGTRTPVVLPMRFNEEFVELLAKHHVPGKREVALMTHFEHPYEITPEAMEAVQKIRSKGIAVYNQGVFTFENARRFEMAALRRNLRLIGVDPYYTFNAKGKEETSEYRVPIARLLQEQAEEARLCPGLERTDEAVFNIPRLGKNYLKAMQDHEVIMINENGQRIYEFYSWDMYDQENESYLFTDVSIYDFMLEMERRSEEQEDYQSIWYYY